MDQPLDKDGWSAYILKHQHSIGRVIGFKEIYEDLKHCVNPDMGELAFMAAYEEIFHDK